MSHTSKRVARFASKELRRRKTTMAQKLSVAGSDLRQASRRKKR